MGPVDKRVRDDEEGGNHLVRSGEGSSNNSDNSCSRGTRDHLGDWEGADSLHNRRDNRDDEEVVEAEAVPRWWKSHLIPFFLFSAK